MEIRQADKNDVQAIARLWHSGWHLGHAEVVDAALVRSRVPEEFVARTQTHLGEAYVGLVGVEIVGFFMIKENELYQFYLGMAHHGSGLANLLMFEAEARLSGPRAWLGCSVGNDRAAAFYVKAGWENMGSEVFEAETSDGICPVNIWRFEKDL
ncbi:GNAT family N-acetyltransferase [uncultured Sulfitobacter sp.]|uniref:GNAT family N-acetyltransferase n=1 Tax=uncultured Sulfitobacter sp. TaxID=191468 RepID=UPI00260247B1|nr:GNAT family N-acetyltransferase [uncultured Sulfitobacter sp.]